MKEICDDCRTVIADDSWGPGPHTVHHCLFEGNDVDGYTPVKSVYVAPDGSKSDAEVEP